MADDFTSFVNERAIFTIWCVVKIETPLIWYRAMTFIFDQAGVSRRASVWDAYDEVIFKISSRNE